MSNRLEDLIQANFHKWLYKEYPEVRLCAYHIANEQTRIGISQLISMGLVPGIPDYHIAIAKGKYHSMYIEFKSEQGKVSAMQKSVHEKLITAGNYVCICYSVTEAMEEFKKYWNADND